MTGAVVLDIGGDVGALVVTAPSALVGAELEICPSGRRGRAPDEGGDWWVGDWRGTHGHAAHGHAASRPSGPAWPHVGVLDRALPGRRVTAAVFPALRAGDYDVWCRPDGPLALRVSVRGGAVTTADWP